MESMGDFYAIALNDDQLRAGLVAMHHGILLLNHLLQLVMMTDLFQLPV